MVNLSIASFINRNIEFGVRLSFGASWKNLIHQGIIESFTFFILSFVSGTALTYFFLYFYESTELFANMRYPIHIDSYLILFLYTLAVPLLANIIAIYKLTRMKPVDLLKGAIL